MMPKKFTERWNSSLMSRFSSRRNPAMGSGVRGEREVMQRLIALGAFTLTLLTQPIVSSAEERSDWRQPLPENVEPPQTIAKRDIASTADFSAKDAQLLLEQAGYGSIGELEQINPFVWRAKGHKDGAMYALTVDYTGTVVGINAP
jgi:hypothetical protein